MERASFSKRSFSPDVTEPTRSSADIAAHLRRLSSHNAESLRRLRRVLSKQLEATPARQVIELAVELLETRAPGSHVVAYELILHHPSALSAIRAADLRRLGNTMESWSEVDTFACYVAGPAWRAGQIADEVIADWTRSQSRWWRRAALVSTVPLNVKAQGGTGDAARTLAVCELLVADRDEMVVKAMSWALRALGVQCPAVTAEFVKRHEGELSPRVIREVRSKLSTGRKSPKRRSSR